MTLQDFYVASKGDYNDVIGRMRNERLVKKFVLKFPSDPSFELLVKSIALRDQPEAFRAVHTIKGICQNLSFTDMYETAVKLTENLRNDWGDDVPVLFEELQKKYLKIIELIEMIDI